MTWIGIGILFLLVMASWFAPHLMRRDLLFGATVAPEFRERREARAIIRAYQRKILLAAIALINSTIFVSLMKKAPHGIWLFAAGFFVVAGSIAFAQANRAMTRHALPASGVREASFLVTPPAMVENSLTVLIGPVILLLGISAALLQARWAAIESIVDKPLSFALGAWAGSFLVLLAFRFGTRRNPAGLTNYRRVILRTSILFNVTFAALTGLVANLGACGHAIGEMEMRSAIAVICVGLAAHIAYLLMLRRKENLALSTATGKPFGDRTPDESWLWGLFYHNAQDPALFVERRSGIGYTVNLGHLRAWLMLAVFLTFIVLPFLLK